MAYNFDIEYEYDPTFEMEESQFAPIESPYVAERWGITDILSSLWRGTGETARIFGRGTGIDSLESAGQYISDTEFAKPDESTYFGNDSYAKEIISGAAEALPTTAVLAGSGALGSLAGPVGTVAGVGAAGAALTRGLYLDGIDRYYEQNPQGTEEDAHNYALMHSAVEGLTEVGGMVLGFGALKLGGAVAKPLIANAINKGVISTAEVLDSVAAKAGSKEFIKKMFGASIPEGGEEVVAAYLQNKIDKKYEMATEDPDYFKTFMIGAVASGPFAAVGAKVTNDQQNQIRKEIEEGLASEDITTRLYTVKEVYDNIAKASPEAAKNWDDYATVAATKGPISLDATIDSSLAWKENVAQFQKERALKKIELEVTKEPGKVLEEAGIPSGFSTNPYGNNPVAPPEEAKINKIVDPVAAKTFWNTKPALWRQENPEPSYIKPYSPYDMSAAMGQVETDTNTVVIPEPEVVETKTKPLSLKARVEANKQSKSTAAETAVTAKKQTLAEKQAAKKAVAEVVPTETAVALDQQKQQVDQNIKVELEEWTEAAKDITLPETERAKAKAEVERLTNTLVEDNSGIPSGPTTGVSADGTTTRVTYSTNKSDWKRLKDYNNVYTRDNGIIVKRNDNSYAAFQKDENGKPVKIGEEYERMSHAIEALNEGLTKEEYYKKYPEKLKRKVAKTDVDTKLTEQQWGYIKSLENPKSFIGSRIRKVAALAGDPEADGVGLDALMEAARKFKDNKKVEFKTFATSIIDAKLKEYNQNRYAKETQAIETVDEGGVAVSSLDSATREDVYEGVETVVQDKKKEEAPPVTKIDVSSLSPEELAKYGQGQKVQKKTADQIKAELEARKQSEESADVEADAVPDEKTLAVEQDKPKKETLAEKEAKKKKEQPKIEKKSAGIKRTKKELTPLEKSKKSFMEIKNEADLITLENDGVIPKGMAKTLFDGVASSEELTKARKEEIWKVAEAVATLETDKGPATIVRKKAVVDTIPKEELNREDSRVLARSILDRAKGDKIAANFVANSIKDTKTREEVRAHLESMEFMTVSKVLEPLLALDKNSKNYKLALFVQKLLKDSGKGDIQVIVDPFAKTDSFSPRKGVVVLRAVSPDAITLHEVVHAITSREISTNSEIRNRIRSVMDLVEQSIIKRPELGVTQDMIKELRSIEPTSGAFYDKFGNEDMGGTRGILYALLNEKEFLAQAMNDKEFQNLLLETEVPVKKGFIRNMFDYVVQLFSDIFGVSRVKHNAMKEIMQLIAETSRVDFSKQIAYPASADGMMIGERSIGVHTGTLLEAQFLYEVGENVEDIRKGTGWWLDGDGKWKYEISDKDAEWMNPFESLGLYNEYDDFAEYSLFDILIHDKLFEAYPRLRDIKVRRDPLMSDGDLGWYDNWSNTIAVNSRLSSPQAMLTLLHEIQHAVQYKEGFTTGTNPDAVEVHKHLDELKGYLVDRRDKMNERGRYGDAENASRALFEAQRLEHVMNARKPILREIKALADSKRNLKEGMRKDLDELQRDINKLDSDTLGRNLTLDEIDKLEGLFAKRNELATTLFRGVEEYDREIQRLKATLPVVNISDTLKYGVYRLTAGEAEARNTSKRSNLSQEALRQVSPLDTMDVPPEYRIFRGIDMGPMSSTTSMKEKKLEKTLEERYKILEQNDISSSPLGTFREFITTKLKTTVKNLAQGMTERLRQIDPRLLRYVRKFEMAINDYNVKYQRLSDSFVEKYKKMSRKDQRMLGLVLLNNMPEDVKLRYDILKKYNMVKDYEKVVEVLKDIHTRKKKVGIGEYDEIPDYFPRLVKDRVGLLQAIQEDPNYGYIEQELSEAGLNEADRERAIERLINTGRYPALALLKPGSSKSRTIERVSSEWAHYYENPIDSLLNHIYESNESIEARRMFGDVRRKDLVSKRDSLMSELKDDKLTKVQRRAIVRRVVKLEAELDVYNTTEGKEAAWHQGIADLLSKEGHKLNANEQMEVIALIRARLLQRGMSGPIQTFRNVSLMMALGNPTSAITQLTDFALSIHNNGLKNTLTSIFGDQLITTKDLDLSHSLREFQTQGSAKVLDKVLKYSGLKFMDIKAKNTFMNAAIKKAQSQSYERFEKEWGSMLGEETKQTFEDLKDGRNTDLTRFFAFNALSEFQPTSLSEMPTAYLTAGNGRLFYALKSYNIKMINNYARKLYYNSKNAKTSVDKFEALRDGVTLLVLMTLAGATADELKDLIMNRDVEFSDNVHNNLLKAFFMNTYMLEQGSKKGMVKTFLSDTLMPPTRMYDDMFKDAANLLDGDPDTEMTIKTLKSLPWGGLVYAWGSDDADKVNMTNVKESISDDIKGGASVSDIRSRMLKYNKWAKRAGEPLITYSTIKNMRDKERVR